MYGALPKNEKTFLFKEVGETTGLTYTGDFTVKCVLDIKSKHSLEIEKTRLQADFANPTPELIGLSTMVATVRAHIVSSPQWWKDLNASQDLLDENIIIKLYNKCLEIELEWKKELNKQVSEKENPSVESK